MVAGNFNILSSLYKGCYICPLRVYGCIQYNDSALTPKQYLKILDSFKLTDLYKLLANKYVLAFIHNLLPSSLNHILFTLSKNQHFHTTRQSTQNSN